MKTKNLFHKFMNYAHSIACLRSSQMNKFDEVFFSSVYTSSHICWHHVTLKCTLRSQQKRKIKYETKQVNNARIQLHIYGNK
jgi:hypothetical protein